MRSALVLVVAGATWCAGPVANATLGSDACRADQVRAIAAEVMADAETRSSLLGVHGDAGHDADGFFISSGDGGFRLKPYGHLQLRYIMDFRGDGEFDGEQDDLSSGFHFRRARFGFTGTVIDGKWGYNIYSDINSGTGEYSLLDAYIERSVREGLRVRGGQFKMPLLREELVADQFQLAAERSIVNAAFTQARSRGVALYYDKGPVTLSGAFNSGLNSLNLSYTDEGNTAFVARGNADWGVTGRVDWYLKGDRKAARDFTSQRGEGLTMVIGAAGHAQMSPNTGDPADTDRFLVEYTTDFTIEKDGWNAYAAFIGRRDALDSTAGDSEFDDFGVIVQGGVRVSEKTEVFGRFEALFPDSGRLAPSRVGEGDDDFYFVTAGVNHYFFGHALKGTADVVVALEETGELQTLGLLPNLATGLLGDMDEHEVLVRLQMQLLF